MGDNSYKKIPSEIGFRKYLIANGYSVFGPGEKHETTVKSYVYAVNRVMRLEGFQTYTDLMLNIVEIQKKYDKYGVSKRFGEMGNFTVINAIKRFAEYVLNECDFNPVLHKYFM